MSKKPPEHKEVGLFKEKYYLLLPIGVWLFFTIGTIFLFPRQSSFRFSDLTPGVVSREEIIAPFTFPILKSDEELEAERSAASAAVYPVFAKTDSISEAQIARLARILEWFTLQADSLQRYQSLQQWTQVDSLRRVMRIELQNLYNIELHPDTWTFILGDQRRRGVLRSRKILQVRELQSLLSEIYSRGILDRQRNRIESRDNRIHLLVDGIERSLDVNELYELQDAQEEALHLLRESFINVDTVVADSAIRAGFEILAPFIIPDIIYDSEETRSRRQRASDSVPISKGFVLKDERIIDSNERITSQHIETLRSLEIARAERAFEEGGFSRLQPIIGRFILSGLIYFILGYFLARFRSDIFYTYNKFLLVASLFGLSVALYGLIILPQEVNQFLFPASLGAIILTIVFDARLSVIFALTLSLMIGALSGSDFFAMLSVFFPSFLAIFSVLRVRTRVQIIRAALFIALGLVIITLIQRQLTYSLGSEMVMDLLFAGVNAIGTPLLALGLMLAIEFMFGVTTDLTLLELADLNRPLLKRLSLEAPGTYHHSIMVGNLAESAAEAIDANPLLVRAGAYYHDIGKMVRREYFVENQIGLGNVHDTLEPEQSAQFLSSHVYDGLKIADEYHLPQAIKAFIREHHGTSLMIYFYNKALHLRPDGSVKEADYRYPGPKPQSKETGILMLADASEAATRTLENPNHEQIKKMVREIVINKYRDRELDECPLTLSDVHKIIDAFTLILEGMHHHRIRYPSREEVEKATGESETKNATETNK